MSTLHALTIAAAAFVIGACTVVDPIGPNRTPYNQDSAQILEGEIRVTLRVAPDAVDSPGTVVATLTYENLGTKTHVLASSHGCVSFASVYSGEDRIPFPSTQYGCTTAVSYRDLAPGVPLTVQWPLVIGGQNGMHVPAGTYRFVAELNTHAQNLERIFVVR